MAYRYGEFNDGPDPLAPPYDVRAALDEMGDAILSGSTPVHALRDLLKRGLPGAQDRRGLDDMLREVRRRRRELRESGRLDGTLEQARALLDKAIGQERAELFPDPSDDARLRESELDSLPDDTASAIQQLTSTSGAPPPPGRPSRSCATCCAAKCSTASSEGCATRWPSRTRRRWSASGR